MQRLTVWGWLYLTLSVATAQTGSEPLEQSVSFREPAQRVQAILQVLSSRTGVRLVAAHEVKDEIVLVEVEHLPLRQLMDGLALALDAEWSLQPDGSYRLSRPVKRALQRRAFDNEQIVKFWRQRLKELAPDNLDRLLTEAEVRSTMRRLREALREAMGRPEERWQILNRTNFYEPLSQISPLRRLLLRLMNQIDLSEAVQIPLREQRIYSNRPGAHLRPFKSNIEPLIHQFLNEAAMVSALCHDPADGVADLLPLFRQQFQYDPIEYTLPVESLKNLTHCTVYLVVSRFSEEVLDLNLVLQRSNGFKEEDLLTQAVYLYRRHETLNLSPEIAWRETPVVLTEKGRLLLSTLAWSEWGFFLSWANNIDEEPNLPERFRSIDPAVVEPLSLAATDILRAYAHARQKPLIALIPDTLTLPYDLDYEIPNPNASLRLGMLESYLAEWEWIEGKVLVAKPHYTSYRWNRRYPRSAPNKIIEQVKRRGYFTGDDYFLARRLAPDAETLHEAQWWFSVNGVQAYLYDQEEVPLLEAIGMSVWRRLLQGETLRVGDLPPSAIRQLNYMAYERALGGVQVDIPEGSYELIPVIFYPDGIPPTMQIRLKKETNIGFFQTYRNGIWSDFEDLATANRLAQQSDEDYLDRYDKYRRRFLKAPAIQYARQIRYTLELIPPDPGGAKLTIWLPDWYELIGKPTRWNEPPDEAKAAFEEAQQAAQDEY